MQTPVRLLVCNRLRNIVRLLINLPIVIIVLKESEVLAPLIFGGIFHFNAIISVLEIYLFYCSLDFTIDHTYSYFCNDYTNDFCYSRCSNLIY